MSCVQHSSASCCAKPPCSSRRFRASSQLKGRYSRCWGARDGKHARCRGWAVMGLTNLGRGGKSTHSVALLVELGEHRP